MTPQQQAAKKRGDESRERRNMGSRKPAMQRRQLSQDSGSMTQGGTAKGKSTPMTSCQDCGINNPVWFAPNELWNKVMNSKQTIICPNCFIVRAENRGIKPTGWQLNQEKLFVTKTSIPTPSPDLEEILSKLAALHYVNPANEDKARVYEEAKAQINLLINEARESSQLATMYPLKEERQKLKVTQADMAVFLGVSRLTYIGYEKDIPRMSIRQYQKAAKELDRLATLGGKK